MQPQTEKYADALIAALNRREYIAVTKKFSGSSNHGQKTKVVIENRKFFCDNPDCGFTTFAERFDFLAQKGKKTKRLIEKIVDVSLNTSSTTASGR